jgi:hypothetical protein
MSFFNQSVAALSKSCLFLTPTTQQPLSKLLRRRLWCPSYPDESIEELAHLCGLPLQSLNLSYCPAIWPRLLRSRRVREGPTESTSSPVTNPNTMSRQLKRKNYALFRKEGTTKRQRKEVEKAATNGCWTGTLTEAPKSIQH